MPHGQWRSTFRRQVELEGMTSHHVNNEINICAHLFSNSYDTSKEKKNPVSSYSMREYVKSERCKTEMVMS